MRFMNKTEPLSNVETRSGTDAPPKTDESIEADPWTDHEERKEMRSDQLTDLTANLVSDKVSSKTAATSAWESRDLVDGTILKMPKAKREEGWF
jgi:hypothetical protein